MTRVTDQAWVTLATNDSYALGALVLGHSLQNANTTRTLVVMVTPTVSPAMRNQLSQVFDLIQEVDVMDSRDSTSLALLARPDLGITFTKLNCWKLTQFTKCVFLDADTMVLQNCDELFEREEFSAAPDAGWPDCFNSGVFVFTPSVETYTALVQFATSTGSFDGGDQGLLNTYFSDWATKDISKHLPFLYNMCATATYTYLPAYRQYGKDVKIIHFIGTSKPWMQHYNERTGEATPRQGEEHLKSHLLSWWQTFMSKVKPYLSKAMLGNLASHRVETELRTAIEQQVERLVLEEPYDMWVKGSELQATFKSVVERTGLRDSWEPQVETKDLYTASEHWVEKNEPHAAVELEFDGRAAVEPGAEKEPLVTVDPGIDRKEPLKMVHPGVDRKEPLVALEPGIDRKESLAAIDLGINRKHPLAAVEPGVDRKHPLATLKPGVDRKEPLATVEPGVDGKEPLDIVKLGVDGKEPLAMVEPGVDGKEPLAMVEPGVDRKEPLATVEPGIERTKLPAACEPGVAEPLHTGNLKEVNEEEMEEVTRGEVTETGMAAVHAYPSAEEIVKTPEQLALEDRLHREAWERGEVDYMGVDSFDNILKKVNSVVASKSTKQPSPEKKSL